MDNNKIKIGDKLVQLSKPYFAPNIDYFGMEDELNMIIASWLKVSDLPPMSPLLVGPAGIGKSEIVYECAKMCKKELYSLQGNEDLSPEDLICMVRISDDPSKKIDYILSGLGTAMIKGGIFFLDGIDKMKAKALALLEGLLDRRQYIDSVILGERIFASSGFRFIASANDIDNFQLPDWILTRMRPIIRFSYPDKEKLNNILKSRFKNLLKENEIIIDSFWRIWKKEFPERKLTPRDVINIFALAQSFADYEGKDKNWLNFTDYCNNNGKIKEKHLKMAIKCI